MYNPFEPSCYAQLSARKRRRIENLNSLFSSIEAPVAIGVGIHDTDELIRQRWQVSVSLGIARAVETVSEMEEVSSKAKLIAGEDRKSKVKNLLSQLSMKHSEGNNAPLSSAGHLEFQSTGGSHSVVESSSSLSQRTVPINGKPSSCILLRNVPRDISSRFAEIVASECSRFGLVRDVRVVADSPGVGHAHILVRFESMTIAFKAATVLAEQRLKVPFSSIDFVSPDSSF